jgi:hypothetical protein
VKIKKIFKILSTVFKIPKKKMIFLNKKYTGHYNVKPTIFKQRTGKILSTGKQKEFKTSLLKLVIDANTLNSK